MLKSKKEIKKGKWKKSKPFFILKLCPEIDSVQSHLKKEVSALDSNERKEGRKNKRKKNKNYYALLVCKDILVFILNWFNLMGWNHTILNVSPHVTYFEEKKNFNCQA